MNFFRNMVRLPGIFFKLAIISQNPVLIINHSIQMLRITILCLLFTGLGCVTTKKTVTDPNSLNGYWKPIKQEIGGRDLPANVFAKQELIINDSVYTVIAESTDKGIVRYNGNKMDIYGKEGVNANKHFTAIFMCENQQLTICYNLKGDSYPETYDTNGKPLYFLSVFKKEALK